MEESTKDFAQWIASAEEYNPISWDQLPELELYMDQVITFMNRKLEPFSADDDHILTPSMINNYVKDGVLPRPVCKKYSQEHLAMLMMLCSLKSVLTLPEINILLQGLTENGAVYEQYPAFAEVYGKALKDVMARIHNAPEQDKDVLYKLALQLALEANARHVTAARILSFLSECEKREKAEKAEKEKAEKAEKEKAEKERAEKEKAEKAEREKAEKEKNHKE